MAHDAHYEKHEVIYNHIQQYYLIGVDQIIYRLYTAPK